MLEPIATAKRSGRDGITSSTQRDQYQLLGVHLLNAHIGKGQQFDWVFVPGVEENHLPDKRNTSPAQLAEEYRVLLVMLSRARHGIVLTRSRTRKGSHGSYTVARSRWWDSLAATATMDADALREHLHRWK